VARFVVTAHVAASTDAEIGRLPFLPRAWVPKSFHRSGEAWQPAAPREFHEIF